MKVIENNVDGCMNGEGQFAMKLKRGYLVVSPSYDPDYPGVFINYRDKLENPTAVQGVALIEEHPDDPSDIRVYVWGNQDIDDPTNTHFIEKSLGDFEGKTVGEFVAAREDTCALLIAADDEQIGPEWDVTLNPYDKKYDEYVIDEMYSDINKIHIYCHKEKEA